MRNFCSLLLVIATLITIPRTARAESRDDTCVSFRVYTPSIRGDHLPADEQEPEKQPIWLAGIIEETSVISETEPTLMMVADNEATGTASLGLPMIGLTDTVQPIPAYATLNTSELTAYDEQTEGFNETEQSLRNQLDRLETGDLPAAEPAKPWIYWKSTSVSTTWVPGTGDRIGLLDFSFRGKIASKRIPFISVSPNYEMTLLNGPQQTDLPNVLHRASVTFMGFIPLSQRFMGQVMVTPGVNTDFHNTSTDAWRTTGMALVVFVQSPQLQWTFGVVYLDREDVSLLPAIGLNWNPDERNRFELTFPRPRYLRQLSAQNGREQWWYLAAEFGGGSWAIEREGGTNDIVTLRDYRLLTGMEYRLPEDRKWFWEAGLVIGRNVEYVSEIGNYSQDPSVFLRAGVTF